MFDGLKSLVGSVEFMLWKRKMSKAMDKTSDALIDMEAESAVKWIDEKIAEGEALKKETDEEAFHEAIDILCATWKRIRIKKMWELTHKD